MKQLAFFSLFVLISSSLLLAQETLIPDKQFMLSCTNVEADEEVTHYINAAGEVWQYNSGTFVTGGVYENSLVTIGNADFGSYSWPGFDFNWLRLDPYWSLGLYKVTNSKQTDKYFYLDARDSDFGSNEYSPDFWIYFDNVEDSYFKREGGAISQGEVVRIWDIHGEPPNTSGLQNYWNNALAIVTYGNNPRLIWGPHPTFQATSYKVYRAVSTTSLGHPELYADLIATVDSNIYEYRDIDISLSSNGYYVYYFVKAYNGYYSNRSNIGSVYGYFYKENLIDDNNKKIMYTLKQNYPNPFNPSTIISFSVAEDSYITIKIYDLLGREVTSLVNEKKEPGYYTVLFNASKLVSGIYFYTLRSNDYSFTKKMLLTK